MNCGRAFSIALPAAVLLTVAIGAAPARAAGEIGLSPDGVVWYDALRRPLFDPERRWVPGDAESASFYVRNEGPTAAQLTIEVRSSGGTDLLAADDVEITARTAGRDWIDIENGTPSSWLTGRALERGGQVRVNVRVRFLWQAPNGSMLDRLPLDFEVRLVEAGAPDADTEDDGPTGLLPDTGSAVSTLIVWVGAGLVGAGLAVIAAARRRRREDPRPEGDEPTVVDAGVGVRG